MSDILKRTVLLAEYKLLSKIYNKKRERKIFNNVYFPPNTDLSIEHYPKHKLFFESGLQYRFRCFIAANRIGKTESAGLYETVCHGINWYPDWWKGLRLESKVGKNINIWIVSDTFTTSAEIIQSKLFYDVEGAEFGTGHLPKEMIIKATPSKIVSGAYSKVVVKRFGGGRCTITFKSSDQGRKKFQGTVCDIVYYDEEPPYDVYQECQMRLAGDAKREGGISYGTFTPLSGMTELIQAYYAAESDPEANQFAVAATWDDAPHLSEAEKKDLIKDIPEYMRDTRTKGIPQLGAGAVYRIPVDEIECDYFVIPDHFERFFGMDVGVKFTAVAFFAKDPNTQIIYMYDEMYIQDKPAIQYASMIKERAENIGGAVDPASMGTSLTDGEKVFNILVNNGLDIIKANNKVEYGINIVETSLLSGRLKVFKNCSNFFREYKTYQREAGKNPGDDNKPKIKKTKDHMMDAVRYGIVSGIIKAKSMSLLKNKINKVDRMTDWQL